MKTFKHILATATLILAFGLLNAQTPPPPNGTGGAPGGGNTPVGGGAAIGGGIAILIALGAGYGAKKAFDFKNRKLEE
nr:hypothetical protein [Bacteroidota bacterium]